VKQFPLIGAWSVALHRRKDGEYVGAILRGNALHADLLCLVDKGRGFAIIRIPPAARHPDEARDIRRIFAPGRTPLDFAVQRALEETLSRELGVPTQLVLSSGATPVHLIVVPPVREAP
jgi:hypothetical protein